MYLSAAVQCRLPSAVYKGVCRPQSNGARGARFTNALRDFFLSNLPETEKICASPARGLRALQPVWVSARNREKIVFAPRGDSRNERSPQEKKPVAKEVSGASPAAKE